MDPIPQNIVAVETPRTQGPGDLVSAGQPYRQYGNMTVGGQGLTVIGDIYNNGPISPMPRVREEVTKFGLCLGAAPQIDPTYFVGRAKEIDEMARVLQPGAHHTKQNRLVLGGMGGVGKTQLAVAYLRRYGRDFDSVFWLNATSQTTLHADLRLMAGRLLSASELERLNDEQVLSRVREWLSSTRNARWLLVFDNYDEPAQFDIGKFCPYTAHGSILITSRLPEHIRLSSHQISVQALSDVEESLEILEKRSRRPQIRNGKPPFVVHCCRATDVFGRSRFSLSGCPIGRPATRSSDSWCISKQRASVTCRQYLDSYEQRWNIDPRRSLYLQEYQDRTLYTTWNLSYSILYRDDADAAHMLRFLAYFDNQSISFELFRADTAEPLPPWLQRLSSDRTEFESLMSSLVEYSFIEIQIATQSYTMHNCLHDWTLAVLNQSLDQKLYWYAFDCVAADINRSDRRSFATLRYASLAAHAIRIAHPRFLQDPLTDDIAACRLDGVRAVATLLTMQNQLVPAAQMFRRALSAYEKILGCEDCRTLSALCDLAGSYRALYSSQDKLDEIAEMYQRAIVGFERVLAAEHLETISAIVYLGRHYIDQGKLYEAEHMYQSALTKLVTTFGPDHSMALYTCRNIGYLYAIQSRFDEAEQMYQRALAGYDRTLGLDNISALEARRGLADVYRAQGKLNQAESLYQQILEQYKVTVGLDHLQTISLFHRIGFLYRSQGRLEEAGDMYRRALSGFQALLGLDHISSRGVMDDLAELSFYKSELERATMVGIQHRTGQAGR